MSIYQQYFFTHVLPPSRYTCLLYYQLSNFHRNKSKKNHQQSDKQAPAKASDKMAHFFSKNMMSGCTDVFCQKFLKVRNCTVFFIQLLCYFVHNKIRFQFLSASWTVFHMVQKPLQLVRRKSSINIAIYHSFCCTAIHPASLLFLLFSFHSICFFCFRRFQTRAADTLYSHYIRILSKKQGICLRNIPCLPTNPISFHRVYKPPEQGSCHFPSKLIHNAVALFQRQSISFSVLFTLFWQPFPFLPLSLIFPQSVSCAPCRLISCIQPHHL